VVDLHEPRPRHRRLRDVGEGADVEEEVAQVGGVELLLVVQRAGALAELDAAVLADDLADRRLVGLDPGAAALVADVAEAGLVQVPAALLEEAEQAVLDGLLRALGGLLGRQ